VVHHASDLTWFEEGRSEFLREQGCFYSDIERDGFFVVVARVEVDYRASSFYEDASTPQPRWKGAGAPARVLLPCN